MKKSTKMKISVGLSEWVSRKRKLMWMARFGAEIAKHNAHMISRSQNIAESGDRLLLLLVYRVKQQPA